MMYSQAPLLTSQWAVTEWLRQIHTLCLWQGRCLADDTKVAGTDLMSTMQTLSLCAK